MTGLPPVVDLCAGTGLLARAIADEGFPVVQGYELHAARADCWGANLGAPCEVRDVRTLTPDELRGHADRDGELVVVGGIPCQDFSTANRQRQMNTELRDHILQLVKAARARAVLENVREGWHGVENVRAMRDCDQGGFTIRVRHFYGLPAVRSTHAEREGRALDGQHLAPWRGWGEALPGYDYMADFSQQDAWQNRRSLQVKHRTAPTWTVTSKDQLVMWQDAARRSLRWIRPAEMARLQGFPRRWRFPSSREDLRSSIADAVPYAMGRAVAAALRRELQAVAVPGRLFQRNRGVPTVPDGACIGALTMDGEDCAFVTTATERSSATGGADRA